MATEVFGFEAEDSICRTLFASVGALIVARAEVPPGPFPDETAVAAWQASVPTKRVRVGGVTIELQTAAMDALLQASDEARARGLSIRPRGTLAAKRTYAQALRLWQLRIGPGLAFWTRRGAISPQEAARIRALPPREQVAEVLRLEEQGLFFSKGFTRSVLSSAAPPGVSQHHSMLALDIWNYDNPAVREILARHGWYQTVPDDQPHFTYLGVPEGQLPGLGLTRRTHAGRVFWIPAA